MFWSKRAALRANTSKRRTRRNSVSALFGAVFATFAWCASVSPAQAYKVQITEYGKSVRWHASTVTLRISPDLEAYLGDLPVAELLSEAAAAWGGLEGVPELLVSRGDPDMMGFREDTTSNGVYLVEDWSLWPDALAATIATFESRTGKLVDADVQVNANYAFGTVAPDPKEEESDHYDLRSVLTHEMGHVLGLGDAEDAPGATMWPIVAPGDTYQRDLDDDDEAGVELVYGDVPPAEARQHAGCGGATVLRPRAPNAQNKRGLWVALSILLALWAWSRARAPLARAGRSGAPRRYTVVLGGVLLFGGLFSTSPTPSVREPARADARASMTWLRREDPRAQRRLAAFVQGADRLIKGKAESRSALRRAGLIWTRFRVQGAFGTAELEFPGGSLGGLTQVVSGHAPPREGELLVVALHKHGPHGWAYVRDGLLYGGTLGAGPALEWP